MLIYHHTKEQLASAVARNLSKNTNDFVYAYVGSTKSVPSMKYVDTTVIRVASHCELPASGVNLSHNQFFKYKT